MERKLWGIYVVCFALSAAAWWSTRSAPSESLGDESNHSDDAMTPMDPARSAPVGRAAPIEADTPGPPSSPSDLPAGIEAFHPPPDGRLRLEHLEMFTQVASRARRGLRREANEAMVQLTEAQVAQSLGYDPRGFRWAQARIQLALLRAHRAEQRASSRALRDQMREQIERLRESAPSEDAKRRIDAQLASMQTSLTETEPAESDTERHNRELVVAHREKLTSALRFGVSSPTPTLQVIEEDSVSNTVAEEDEGSDLEDEEFLPLEPQASSAETSSTPPVANPGSSEASP